MKTKQNVFVCHTVIVRRNYCTAIYACVTCPVKRLLNSSVTLAYYFYVRQPTILKKLRTSRLLSNLRVNYITASKATGRGIG